jgi:hypothetical protein
MKTKRTRRCLIVALPLACGLTGCDWVTLGSSAVSFVLGAATASAVQTTTTEYRCFRNGVEIDCGSLPELLD